VASAAVRGSAIVNGLSARGEDSRDYHFAREKEGKEESSPRRKAEAEMAQNDDAARRKIGSSAAVFASAAR